MILSRCFLIDSDVGNVETIGSLRTALHEAVGSGVIELQDFYLLLQRWERFSIWLLLTSEILTLKHALQVFQLISHAFTLNYLSLQICSASTFKMIPFGTWTHSPDLDIIAVYYFYDVTKHILWIQLRNPKGEMNSYKISGEGDCLHFAVWFCKRVNNDMTRA